MWVAVDFKRLLISNAAYGRFASFTEPISKNLYAPARKPAVGSVCFDNQTLPTAGLHPLQNPFQKTPKSFFISFCYGKYRTI